MRSLQGRARRLAPAKNEFAALVRQQIVRRPGQVLDQAFTPCDQVTHPVKVGELPNEVTVGQSFLLGDTPVVLANHNDTGPYGNLGLDVVGIEIYLPISPSLALAFWCPTIVETLRKARARCEQSLARTTAVALLGVGEEVQHMRAMRAELTQKAAKLRADLAAIEAQTPLKQSTDNMDYVNALQVGCAERYLISATGDFALAKRMIADNACYRRGRRPELA